MILSPKDLEAIKQRWQPYAYVSRLPGDREDVQALLAHIAIQHEHLRECHSLLVSIVGFSRPLPGGLQAEALELLEAHGIAPRKESA